MKKIIILLLTISICLCSCTEQERTRIYGGEMTINLPAGQELMMVTWKDNDLFFAPEKHEGWANLYKGNAHYHLGSTFFYQSEVEAKKFIAKNCGYVGTIKVEWEE